VDFLCSTVQNRWMVDLRRVRALREVADRGTIAAAADALHLTSSAVSQQLAALEREVGVALIEPSGRTVRLTPAAHVLLEHAGPLFAQLERLRSELDAHAAGEIGDVRITAFPTAIAGIVAPAIADLKVTAPRVRVRVHEAEAPEALLALTDRTADVLITMESGHMPPIDDPRFHRRDLVRDTLDAVVPADHPLAAREQIELTDLAGDPWVAPLAGWSCDHVVQTGCQAAGFTPVVEHRTTDWFAAMSLVAAGLGVGLVPRLAQPHPPEGVVIRPLAGEAPCRHLFALCRGGAEHGRAIATVLDALERASSGAVEEPHARVALRARHVRPDAADHAAPARPAVEAA
jgi:DNA-binding transcriptional LysR family regulator